MATSKRVVRYLAREYLRRFRWPVRIFPWVLSAAAASLAGRRYSPAGPAALEVTFLAVVLARFPAAKAVAAAGARGKVPAGTSGLSRG